MASISQFPSPFLVHRGVIPNQVRLASVKKPRKVCSRLFSVCSVGARKADDGYGKAAETLRPFDALEPDSRILVFEAPKTHTKKKVAVKSSGSETGLTSEGVQTMVLKLLHLVVSLGIIVYMDKLLKKAFVDAAIKFPSALFGMFCIFTILMVLDATIPDAATTLLDFFQPALVFIQRWLPLFYVPSLVVLPLAVKDIPAASGFKILLIVVGGWLASLSVAGFTAIAVRKLVNTEMIPAEPMQAFSLFFTRIMALGRYFPRIIRISISLPHCTWNQC